jgi:hypothetical protein
MPLKTQTKFSAVIAALILYSLWVGDMEGMVQNVDLTITAWHKGKQMGCCWGEIGI